MNIGICQSPEGAASLPAVFDYLEVNVQAFLVPEADEAAFLPHLEAATQGARPVRAANCFLPAGLKSVGPDLDRARLLRYAETAFARAQRAGIRTIVFGSGGSRQVPAGYPVDQAAKDFIAVLKMIAPAAGAHDVTVVVEPLGRRECNFINSVAEGAAVVEQCNHPAVRLLADSYHMRTDNEPFDQVARFGRLIRHVHIAELENRGWPGRTREDQTAFFAALKQSGYTGSVSMECSWDDPAANLPPAVEWIREMLSRAGF
jgi:sugar phosphate isomerase/epimerase